MRMVAKKLSMSISHKVLKTSVHLGYLQRFNDGYLIEEQSNTAAFLPHFR